MKQPPTIIMQLIHIEGPLKGEIQEFPEAEVTIGRNPSCNIHYPKDLGVVSRQHARIVREGNRFKLVDQSSNGTYLNGKAVSEAYIKDGDVLMFAEGGPKVSFLTQTVTGSPNAPVMTPPPPPEPPRSSELPRREPIQEPVPPPVPPQTPSARPQPVNAPPARPAVENVYRPAAAASTPVQPPSDNAFGAAGPEQVSVQRIKKPLFIQYGPTLRSYNELPVTIGQGAQCDFVLNHPSVFERHAQILFYQENYWIKDLSGKNPMLINGRPVDREGILEPDCRLSMSSSGPEFRFLGGGRLAEIEAAPEETPVQTDGAGNPEQQNNPSSPSGFKEIGGKIKRFLKK